jgi:hypothetical protein
MELVHEYRKKFVIVLSKIDILDDPQQIEQLKMYVTEQCRKFFGLEELEIFPVSSKLALKAKAAVSHIQDSEVFILSLFLSLSLCVCVCVCVCLFPSDNTNQKSPIISLSHSKSVSFLLTHQTFLLRNDTVNFKKILIGSSHALEHWKLTFCSI